MERFVSATRIFSRQLNHNLSSLSELIHLDELTNAGVFQVETLLLLMLFKTLGTAGWRTEKGKMAFIARRQTVGFGGDVVKRCS